MQIDVRVECPVHESFRVRQIAGMFDTPLAPTLCERFQVELPDLSEDWQIGVIVGPSGSGKSTVARAAYGDDLCQSAAWPDDRAVIDAFEPAPIKRIAHALSAVGFSSPREWIKPYRVLSGGQRFRCDLARALLSPRPLVAFDEFTSVVDRNVAKIGSAAVAKALRGRRIEKRFVAVTCHYDVLPWLAPDWTLDLAVGRLQRGRLRRPSLALRVFRCRRAAWRLFAKHHYLSGALNPAAECYLATCDGEPVAFCGLLHSIGHRDIVRVSRLVVLPDYQGIGVGGRFLGAVAERNRARGLRTTITSSHPAMIGFLKSSQDWRIARVAKAGARWSGLARKKNIRGTSLGRAVVSAEYRGAS